MKYSMYPVDEISIKIIIKKRLNQKFYNLPTIKLAKALLGKYLIRKLNGKYLAGLITETEAYLSSDDFASHSAVGYTERNKFMFGKPGLAYIYFIYGAHFSFNVVSMPEGTGEAVLIRALQPVFNLNLMKKFRKTEKISELTNGPAKLCMALKIDKKLNGTDLVTSDKLFLCDNKISPEIQISERIGISKSKEKMLRFYIKGNSFVSKR